VLLSDAQMAEVIAKFQGYGRTALRPA